MSTPQPSKDELQAGKDELLARAGKPSEEALTCSSHERVFRVLCAPSPCPSPSPRERVGVRVAHVFTHNPG